MTRWESQLLARSSQSCHLFHPHFAHEGGDVTRARAVGILNQPSTGTGLDAPVARAPANTKKTSSVRTRELHIPCAPGS
jgi:hypothetical protein